MSTPNFKKTNAKHYYAIDIVDDFDYDCIVDNIRIEFGKENSIDEWDNDRSYPGRIVSRIYYDVRNWSLRFDIIIRGGYYSGVNLDWGLIVRNDKNYDEFERGYYEESDLPKYVRNAIDAKIKRIERVFFENSVPLVCRAIFSNGEAIYEKIK